MMDGENKGEGLPLSKMSYSANDVGDTPLLGTGEGATYGHRGLIDGWLRPCAAEFVGTTLFVAVGTLAGITAGDLVSASLTHGLMIALLVAGMGPISGGHINPTVTLGCALAGATKPALAVGYALSQFLGAVVGAAICRGSIGNAAFAEGFGGATMLPLLNETTGETATTVGGAIICEATVTCILVLTVLVTAVDSDGPKVVAPLVIGFAVAVGIFASANVSGASINPARTFGPAVVVSGLKTSRSVWEYQYIYWVGPVIGSVFASAIYRFLLANNEKRVILKTE